MFGYVTPLKPELKIREYEMFRGYYCGICMHIKERFGNIPRMALNYDMAFLGLLLDSLHIEDPKIEFRKCMAHPLKNKPMILNNKALEYAAAMNVSLVYYKLIDDVNDEKSFKSKIESIALAPYKRKFNRNVTIINDIIEENLNLLSNLEKSKDFSSIDEISHPFSLIVAKILELYPESINEDCDDFAGDRPRKVWRYLREACLFWLQSRSDGRTSRRFLGSRRHCRCMEPRRGIPDKSRILR